MFSGAYLKYLNAFLFLLVAFSPLSAQKSIQADGPYVFYKDGAIIVKSIHMSADTVYSAAEKKFKNKKNIILNCYSEETGDTFSFRLKNSISPEKSLLPAAKRIFVLSDIEGNFKGFKSILKGAGIIDDNFRWTFGDGHFVMLGDVFDRGAEPTECLWLLYKLESEAEKHGGKLHFILGNHEIMNLNNNTKYVDKLILKNSFLIRKSYDSLYGIDSELGRWLRSKNIAMKIGDLLFVHAGISSSIDSLNLSIENLNKITLANIGLRKEQIKGAENLAVTSSKIGPYWYRGYFNDAVDEESLGRILKKYDAQRIIVGHTIVDTISYLFNGKVIAVDEEHQENIKKGYMHALLIENGKFYIIDDKGMKKRVGKYKKGN